MIKNAFISLSRHNRDRSLVIKNAFILLSRYNKDANKVLFNTNCLFVSVSVFMALSLCVCLCVHACVCVYVSVPVTLSVGPADLGCHGDGCHSAVATVTETAGFRVISASHLGRQTSAIYSKPYMITAFFF